MTNTTITFNSADEMNTFLFEEVKRVSKKAVLGSHLNADDIESFLMIRVWNYVTNNKNFQTKKGIRQVIKSRLLDFLKSSNQNSPDLTFSALSSEDEDGSEQDFEASFVPSGYVDTADTVSESILLKGFMDTLTDRQRTIVQLRAGILDSLTVSEMEVAKEIMAKQSSKKSSGEVYLSNSDIAKIIGIGRVKVQNHLAKISEKALDFGLEEIV